MTDPEDDAPDDLDATPLEPCERPTEEQRIPLRDAIIIEDADA